MSNEFIAILYHVDKSFNFCLSISHYSISIPVIHAHILRLSCLTYANFSIVKSDHKLTTGNLLLQTFNDVSEDECEDKCTKHQLCKSINTRNTSGVNCELNGKSTEDPFDNVMLSGSNGWTYKTTDHKARNVSLFF